MHTKGKWVFTKHEEPSQWHGNIIIEKGKGSDGIMNIRTVACLTKYGSEEENEANARHIVHCVNTHDENERKAKLNDELVKIIETLLSCLLAAKAYPQTMNLWDDEIDKAEQLLAKAKGGV